MDACVYQVSFFYFYKIFIVCSYNRYKTTKAVSSFGSLCYSDTDCKKHFIRVVLNLYCAIVF